jgi:ubiquinone/menaquinone biosynthesis C-methylase UbiE
MNPEKNFIRQHSNDTWIRELKERAEQKNFEDWNDLINEEDYIEHFEKYFGGLEYFKDKDFVDLGAGFGGILHSLVKKYGARITNIDIAPDAVEYLKQQGENGIIASVYDLPQEDNSVDGIISTNLLNTTVAMDKDDMLEILKQAYRVLKENAPFIQSHYGDVQMPISSEEQLQFLREIGFKDIDVIENLSSSKLMHDQGYFGDLAFIAKK